MYASNSILKAEMDYRANRIRAGVGSKRRGHVRGRSRRPAEATESAR